MRNSYEEILGRNLKRLRLLRGVTQSKMAGIAGVSQKTISNLENADSMTSARMETVTKVAEYFSVHPAVLMMDHITDDTLTDTEVSVMVERFAQLSAEHKRRIMDMINDLWMLRPER